MAATIITSVVTGGTNSHATTVAEVNAVGTDFFSQGVVGVMTNTSGVAPATGGYAVNAQGTPNMTVAVSGGTAWITATPSGQTSQLLRAYSASGDSAYTINANTSGSTKYDWIYLKVDPTAANNPASDGSDVTAIFTSRSSSNTTDNGSPPSYGILLAIITVANGASSISNSNILDGRTQSGLARSAGGWTGVTDAWSYASYTSPAGTITVPSDATTKYSAGMKVKFTNNGSVQYGFITKVSSTVLTVFFGTDYSLTNSAITNIYFSSQKAPLGFPLDPAKWTVSVTDSSNHTQSSATNATWYDSTVSISVPIGSWRLSHMCLALAGSTSTTALDATATLSTTTNSETNSYLTTKSSPGSVVRSAIRAKAEDTVTVTSATTYHLLMRVAGSGTLSIGIRGDDTVTGIKAVCTYL